ncbi:hypothetical protein Tco_0110106 [Tanacetum coccineum]
MGWNRNDVDVVVIDQDDQVIHTRIWLKTERKEVFCSFIYAQQQIILSSLFWRSLASIIYIRHRTVGHYGRFLIHRVLGVQVRVAAVYTWTQKPKGGHSILKKLDRIMANLEFNDVFMGAHAMFKPYRISDHTPSVLCIPTLGKAKPKPFKFFNVLIFLELFLDVVQD